MRSPSLVRTSLACLLGLAACAAATRAQPPTISPPLNYYAMLYLGDERLQKELKLTPEQAKKMTALLETTSPFMFAGMAGKGSNTTQSKAREAFEKGLAAVLKPEQAKRLREVLYQQMEKIPVGPLVLSGDDEVGKALKLTDEQKTKLRARVSLDSVLTAEQKKEWKKIQGSAFEGTLVMSSPFMRTTIGTPARVQYLEQESVRTDLKLSQVQKTQVEALRKDWEKNAPRSRPRMNSEEAKKVTAMQAEYEKKADALLEAGQLKRLDQIELQQALTNGRESDVFTQRKVIEAAKIDEKQQAKIRAIQEERTTGLLGLFVRDEAVAKITSQVEEYKKETYLQLNGVLTAEQQAKVKDAIGEPFKGPIRLVFGGMGASPATPTTPIYVVFVGLSSYAGSKALHEELKLSKEQVDELARLQTKLREERLPVSTDEALEKKRKAQAEAMKKDLAKILDAGQMKRFEQLILQTYVRPANTGGFAPPSQLRNRTLTRLHEVRQGLKLSEEQKKKLIDGTEIDKVLEAGQLATWKEMLGKPFEGNLRQTIAGPGGFRQAPTLAVQALQTKAIQAELKLTEKQIESVRELEKKYQEKLTAAGNIQNRQEFIKQRQAVGKELDDGCKKLLGAGQAKRLNEIVLQHAHRVGFNSLLLQPAAIEGLALDEKQVAHLADLRRDDSVLFGLFVREFGFGGGRPVSRREQAITEARTTMNTNFQKKVEATLTGAQKGKLKELLGEPFEGRIDTSRSGGGFQFP